MTSFVIFSMTSSAELLIEIDRGAPSTLGAQLQAQLRNSIRSGALRAGTLLPSTRALSDQIDVSRPIVVEAYEQLAAEGYLQTRRGARAIVSEHVQVSAALAGARRTREPVVRFDLRPAVPDLSQFPRKLWLRSVREVLATMPNGALGYDSPHGTAQLRSALAEYLGRVRGVIAHPEHIIVTSGFAEARAIACEVFAGRGIARLAVEDPGYSAWQTVERAGLTRIPIPVDRDGLDVRRLDLVGAQAVFVTPAHQFPTGVVLAKNRRVELIRWLHQRGAFALEDDYDVEFRYDHAPIGALQGLAPDRILYAGTVSKTLAPALRLGWLAVPRSLVEAARSAQRLWGEGIPRIEQNALARLIESGGYDRQLRKMRRLYRMRRDTLVSSLSRHLPIAEITGIAAGLHATVGLPGAIKEEWLLSQLRKRGVAADGMNRYRASPGKQAVLLLGYGRAPESALRSAVRVLADVVARVPRAAAPHGG